MATGRRPDRSSRSRRILAVVGSLAVVSVLVALIFVPVQGSTQVLQVSAGGSAVVNLAVPRPGWVTVHFDRAGGYRGMPAGSGMHYWMDGPSSAMFDHSMMPGGDAYSFWSWGGHYRCGVGYVGPTGEPISVWVNSSWGVL